MKRNKFNKALKHLKSRKVDDKIKKLEEAAPTNNMSGVYQVSPSAGDAFRLGQPDAPKRFYTKADGTWPAGIPGDPNKVFYDRPAGYWGSGRNTTPEVGEPTKRDFTYADVTANGNTNTDQFIRPSDGKVYTALPEGSENVILGPLVTSYAINHGYDDYTNLGYIQKDTRQFVLLARIQGFFKGEDRPRTSYLSHGNIARTWDGTASQLTIYNSNFTLEYALWMKDRYEKGNFTPNFPFRFSGGIPVERHPDDGSMGAGDIMGTDDGQQSADGDTSGTEQDPPDDNDIESLDLWGLTAEELAGMSEEELAENDPPLMRDPDTGDIREMTDDEKNDYDSRVLGLTPEQWNQIGQTIDAGMLALDVLAVLGTIFSRTRIISCWIHVSRCKI